MNIEHIEATTISDSWFQAVSRIIDRGFKYEIQQGSFVGQTRLEFDFVTIYIKHPYAEPYDLMLPQIPVHLGIPNPVASGYIEQYMPYLMTGHIEKAEQYCYDSKTEVLTLEGWKNFSDIKIGDLIATLNPKVHNLEYYPAINIHQADYNGLMYHFKNIQIDCKVTPNHTMFIKDSNKLDMDFVIKKAKDVNQRRVFFKKDCIWEGNEQKYFILPSITYNNDRYKDYGKERKILMDDWLVFFGTWLADGSLRRYKDCNSYQITITKYNKPEWCERILRKLFTSVSYHKKDFIVSDKQIYTYLQSFGLSGDKYIPKYILNLSARQLKLLFSAMYKCDGDKNKNNSFVRYSTKSKQLADDVQELCLKIGLCGNIRSDSGIYRINIGRVGTNYMNNTNPGLLNKQIKKLEYVGNIFCCEVERNHIIYVRRNGTPCWSGNTYGSRINNFFMSYDDTGKKVLSGNQIEHWIDVLRRTPNTNQAVLQVAQPSDCLLDDPPCLRSIKLRIKDNQLAFYPYFRSNDLWSGYPANLAGLAVLQKYMADEIGVESGPMVYFSDGLHIYGYVEELAKLRAGK